MRDLDLIRKLLIHIAEQPLDRKGDLEFEHFEDYPPVVVTHHLLLLGDAGYIVGLTEPAGRYYIARRLTWQGYEFLDAMRDSKRWKKAKEIADKAGGVTVDLLKAVLVELAKSTLKEFM